MPDHVIRLVRGIAPPARLLLWPAAGLAVAWLLWGVLRPAATAHSFGFASYYTSAQLLIAGDFGPEIYDNAWFQAQERARGLREDIYGIQPPTMALLMVPVAWMPPDAARVAWLALDLLWLTATGFLTIAAARSAGIAVGPGLVPVLIIIICLYRPLHAELRYAQVYTLLGLWYTIWLYGYVTGRDWLCGLALAGLALAKLAGAPLWLALLATRRWRALALAAGLTLAGMVLSLPLVGADTWHAYLFGRAGGLAADGLFGVTALQTLVGLLRQLFVLAPPYTPAPLLDAPWLAAALWLACAVALLWPTLRACALSRRGPSSALLWAGAAMLCLVVPLQPAGEQHHYVIILASLLLLVVRMHHAPCNMQYAMALLALSGALFLAPGYFLDNAAWAGWPQALLAYPRLYGSLALWAALLITWSSDDNRTSG